MHKKLYSIAIIIILLILVSFQHAGIAHARATPIDLSVGREPPETQTWSPTSTRDSADAVLIIELEPLPLATYVTQQLGMGKITLSQHETRAYTTQIDKFQNRIVEALSKLGVKSVISRYSVAYNGLLVRMDRSLIEDVQALDGVTAVHPAPRHTPHLGTSVPYLGIPGVWENLGYTGKGVTVAVIDTGIDYTHAALGGSGDPNDYTQNDPDHTDDYPFPTTKVVDGYDFAGTDYNGNNTPTPDPDPLDEYRYGHGTHVASIAAGIAAGEVMTGVAPGANLIALKIFGQTGSSYLTVDAIEWAASRYMTEGTPEILNLSIGSDYGTNDPEIDAINNAAALGLVVVASAGNAGDTSYIVSSPAVADGAISVASSTIHAYSTADGDTQEGFALSSDSISSFSSRGPRGTDSTLKPEVTAPGRAIYAAKQGSGTEAMGMSGTSMAAPHVAGLAALMVEAETQSPVPNPPLTRPQRIKAAMMNTASDLGANAPIPRQGAGRISPEAAIQAIISEGIPTLAYADPDVISANWGVSACNQARCTLSQDITVWSGYTSSPLTYTAEASLQAEAMLQAMDITTTKELTEAITIDLSPNNLVLDTSSGPVTETVKLTLTIDGTAFPVGFGVLEEVYGFVTLTPDASVQSMSPTPHEMRVPFYAIPRPYTILTDIKTNTSITTPAALRMNATLSETGPISPVLHTMPALAYEPSGALRMMGMDYKGEDETYGDILAAAFNTYAPWPTPQPYFIKLNLYLDVDEDGMYDYRLSNSNMGTYNDKADTDEWVIVQHDLSNNDVSLASPYPIDTDYSANVMTWYLPATQNGLGEGNTTFDYLLQAFDYTTGHQSQVSGRFNYARPAYTITLTRPDQREAGEFLLESSLTDFADYGYILPRGTMLINDSGDPRGIGTDQYQARFFAGPILASIYLPVMLR